MKKYLIYFGKDTYETNRQIEQFIKEDKQRLITTEVIQIKDPEDYEAIDFIMEEQKQIGQEVDILRENNIHYHSFEQQVLSEYNKARVFPAFGKSLKEQQPVNTEPQSEQNDINKDIVVRQLQDFIQFSDATNNFTIPNKKTIIESKIIPFFNLQPKDMNGLATIQKGLKALSDVNQKRTYFWGWRNTIITTSNYQEKYQELIQNISDITKQQDFTAFIYFPFNQQVKGTADQLTKYSSIINGISEESPLYFTPVTPQERPSKYLSYPLKTIKYFQQQNAGKLQNQTYWSWLSVDEMEQLQSVSQQVGGMKLYQPTNIITMFQRLIDKGIVTVAENKNIQSFTFQPDKQVSTTSFNEGQKINEFIKKQGQKDKQPKKLSPEQAASLKDPRNLFLVETLNQIQDKDAWEKSLQKSKKSFDDWWKGTALHQAFEADATVIKDNLTTIGGGLAVDIYDTIKKGIEDKKNDVKMANGSPEMKQYHMMNQPNFQQFSKCFDEKGFLKSK